MKIYKHTFRGTNRRFRKGPLKAITECLQNNKIKRAKTTYLNHSSTCRQLLFNQNIVLSELNLKIACQNIIYHENSHIKTSPKTIINEKSEGEAFHFISLPDDSL